MYLYRFTCKGLFVQVYFYRFVTGYGNTGCPSPSDCALLLLQSFAKRQVRDTAEEVPVDYAPPDFTTAALQHTNVKLTWDADDDTRKKALRKKMTEDSIRDDDFKVSFAAERPVVSASPV